MCFSISTFFQVFLHIPGRTVCISHFPSLSVFLAMFQVIQFLCLIFRVFQFSRHIAGSAVCVYFPRFSVFSQYSRSYSLFLIFHVFQFSRHNPGAKVCVSHFPRFSVFLAVFQVIQCLFPIFHVFQFSCHIPSPTVCISHSTFFTIFFLPYSKFCSEHFSFSMLFSVFSVFLAMYQVIHSLCFIFHVF